MASLSEAWRWISTVLLFFMMLGLGSSLQFDAFREKIQKPKGILIGIFSQFIFMPFFCWAATRIFPVKDQYAVALITIGCCPGGALSNTLCYVFQTDVTLSIAMTACSSFAAIGMMPLNTFIYIDALGDNDVGFDWIGMISAVSVVTAGTFCGVYISKNYPDETWKTEKIAGYCIPILLLGTVIINQITGGGGGLFGAPPIIYLVTLMPTLAGTCVGMGLSTLFGLAKPSRVAVSVETAVQNQYLALAIITLTLDDKDDRADAITVPVVYAMYSAAWNISMCYFLFTRGWTLAPEGMTPYAAFMEYRRNRKAGLVGEIARRPTIDPHAQEPCEDESGGKNTPQPRAGGDMEMVASTTGRSDDPDSPKMSIPTTTNGTGHTPQPSSTQTVFTPSVTNPDGPDGDMA